MIVSLQFSQYFLSFTLINSYTLCGILADNLNSVLPIVINTWEFKEANEAAADILKNNGNALDAVEKGCQVCEEMQCGSTVGFGGSPDENGETTLDAMIMDGRRMKAGAVGALRNVKDAVSVARHILENTEHTFLVGSQATEFALKMGFKKETLSTSYSKAVWKKWKSKNCQPNFWLNVDPNPTDFCGPYHPLLNEIYFDNERSFSTKNNHDTIGMIAIDKNHDIAVATSTNGASHKIPGRVGDSPVLGSGGYVENGIGGATCTGDGDIMMRFVPSFKAVEGLRNGLTAQEAAKYALNNIKKFYPKYFGAIVVISASGDYAAACHGMSQFPFSITKGQYPTEIITIDC